VHRIGRTGRAGRSGKSITLCLPFEEKYLAKIEELVEKAIPALESPLGAAEAAEIEPRAPAPERLRSERGRRSEPRREPRPVAPVAPASEPEPRSETPRSEAWRGEAPRSETARGEAPRRERGRRGNDMPGMGEHVPAFLMREFRFDDAPDEAVAEPVAEEPVVDVPEPAVAEAVAAEPLVEKAAPKSRRRSRAKSADAVAVPPAA
jgi:ATP-dependent RNA helicase RhlE